MYQAALEEQQSSPTLNHNLQTLVFMPQFRHRVALTLAAYKSGGDRQAAPFQRLVREGSCHGPLPRPRPTTATSLPQHQMCSAICYTPQPLTHTHTPLTLTTTNASNHAEIFTLCSPTRCLCWSAASKQGRKLTPPSSAARLALLFFIINKIADFILRVSAKCSLAIYHMLQTPDVCSTVTESDGFVFGYKEMSKTTNVQCFLQALKSMLKAPIDLQSWRRAPKAAVRPASASCLWDKCATIVQLGAVTNE